MILDNHIHNSPEWGPCISMAYMEEAYSETPPDWAKGPMNGNAASQCGDCGAWTESVRPGKTQCGVCELDGRTNEWQRANPEQHQEADRQIREIEERGQ